VRWCSQSPDPARLPDLLSDVLAPATGSPRFGDVSFNAATFTRNVWFDQAVFRSHARFGSASFESASTFGPLVCRGLLDLSGASCGAPITIEAAAKFLACRRTRWSATATIWLRYAQTDLSDAVFDHPLTVAARLRPFVLLTGRALDESALAGVDQQAQVTSLRGVDAAHLVLTDLDLSSCLFSGTVHLDQLRLEGRCPFCTVPAGVHRRRRFPVRNTPRSTIAEEQHWRHAQPAAVPGWRPAPRSIDVVQPAALAAVYRALRKS
jgi:uncharacterized protein YjbI with pentapeptide repeats